MTLFLVLQPSDDSAASGTAAAAAAAAVITSAWAATGTPSPTSGNAINLIADMA